MSKLVRRQTASGAWRFLRRAGKFVTNACASLCCGPQTLTFYKCFPCADTVCTTGTHPAIYINAAFADQVGHAPLIVWHGWCYRPNYNLSYAVLPNGGIYATDYTTPNPPNENNCQAPECNSPVCYVKCLSCDGGPDYWAIPPGNGVGAFNAIGFNTPGCFRCSAAYGTRTTPPDTDHLAVYTDANPPVTCCDCSAGTACCLHTTGQPFYLSCGGDPPANIPCCCPSLADGCDAIAISVSRSWSYFDDDPINGGTLHRETYVDTYQFTVQAVGGGLVFSGVTGTSVATSYYSGRDTGDPTTYGYDYTATTTYDGSPGYDNYLLGMIGGGITCPATISVAGMRAPPGFSGAFQFMSGGIGLPCENPNIPYQHGTVRGVGTCRTASYNFAGDGFYSDPAQSGDPAQHYNLFGFGQSSISSIRCDTGPGGTVKGKGGAKPNTVAALNHILEAL